MPGIRNPSTAERAAADNHEQFLNDPTGPRRNMTNTAATNTTQNTAAMMASNPTASRAVLDYNAKVTLFDAHLVIAQEQFDRAQAYLDLIPVADRPGHAAVSKFREAQMRLASVQASVDYLTANPVVS